MKKPYFGLFADVTYGILLFEPFYTRYQQIITFSPFFWRVKKKPLWGKTYKLYEFCFKFYGKVAVLP